MIMVVHMLCMLQHLGVSSLSRLEESASALGLHVLRVEPIDPLSSLADVIFNEEVEDMLCFLFSALTLSADVG